MFAGYPISLFMISNMPSDNCLPFPQKKHLLLVPRAVTSSGCLFVCFMISPAKWACAALRVLTGLSECCRFSILEEFQ